MDQVIEYVRAQHSHYVEELKSFLRIPSVSSDARHTADMARAAEFVAKQLRDAGVPNVEPTPTAGHPIVFGEWTIDRSRPTVLLYGHYDVQPVDPLELWETGPFEPTVRDGRIYARGATDDKGQLMVHFKGIETFTRLGGKPPVNLKFLIEGEEEIGSPNLEPFIRKNVGGLSCDAVLISDTSMFAPDVPSICYGLRGLAYLEIQVRGPNRDLHSGSFGGPVLNPANALATLIAAMRDERGKIAIPHFYDDVLPLTDREREEWRRLPFDEGSFKKDLEVEALDGEAGYSPLELLWARPTLDVNGMLSGFTGEGAKTVLPSKAMAKVSMRLVPNQDPRRIEELFSEFVRSRTPAGVQVEVRALHGGKPWVAPLDHPALQAGAQALEKAFGRRPVFQREGGSIPVVATFDELLHVPVVLLGFGLPSENAHAPNEHFHLDHFFKGIETSAHFLQLFAAQHRA